MRASVLADFRDEFDVLSVVAPEMAHDATQRFLERFVMALLQGFPEELCARASIQHGWRTMLRG